jgi:hypothetical protein
MAADCGDFTENTTRLGTWIAVRRLGERTLYFVGMAMSGQLWLPARQNVDARHKAGHDGGELERTS